MTTAVRTRKPPSPAKQAKRKAARAEALATVKACDNYEIDGGRELRAFDSLTGHYSEGNAVLILAQAAQLGLTIRGLSDVGGFNAFAERGRIVRKGEHRSLLIWAPAGSSADADKVEESADGQGVKVRRYFKIMGIFHVSQTDPADRGTDDAQLQERQAAVDVDRRAGETREQATQRAYMDWVYVRYMAAEQATRGNLLTREAEGQRIDPVTLFSGPEHVARKHASEELQTWWAENGGRKTYAQYRADVLGRPSDLRAVA